MSDNIPSLEELRVPEDPFEINQEEPDLVSLEELVLPTHIERLAAGDTFEDIVEHEAPQPAGFFEGFQSAMTDNTLGPLESLADNAMELGDFLGELATGQDAEFEYTPFFERSLERHEMTDEGNVGHVFGDSLSMGVGFALGLGELTRFGIRNMASRNASSVPEFTEQILRNRQALREAGVGFNPRVVARVFPEGETARLIRQTAGLAEDANLGGRLPSFVLEAANMQVTNPKRFYASELTLAITSAAAGAGAEALLPGNEVARLGAEVTGGAAGLANRTIKAVSTKAKAIGRMLGIGKSEELFMREGAEAIASVLKEHGNDPEAVGKSLQQALESLRNLGVEGLDNPNALVEDATAASIIDNDIVTGIHNWASADADWATDIAQRSENFRNNLILISRGLREVGNPEALGAAKALERQAALQVIEDRLGMAGVEVRSAIQAMEGASGATPETLRAARQDASRRVSEIVRDVRNDLLEAQKVAWAQVDLSQTLDSMPQLDSLRANVRASLDTAIERYPNSPLPEDIGILDNIINGTATIGELRQVRSGGLGPSGNVGREIMGVINDDMKALYEAVDVEGINVARAISERIRSFNSNRVVRALASEMSESGSTPTGFMDDGVSFDRLFQTTRDSTNVANVNMTREILDQAENVLGRFREGSPGLMDELASAFGGSRADAFSNEVAEQVRIAGLGFVRESSDGVQTIDYAKLSRHISNNPEILEQYPAVREVLSDAAEAARYFDELEKSAQIHRKELGNNKQFEAMFGTPSDPMPNSRIVERVLRAPNPDDGFAEMAEMALKAEANGEVVGAVEGLRGAAIEHVFMSSARGNKDLATDWDKVHDTLFSSTSRKNSTQSLADLMVNTGVMNQNQRDFLEAIVITGQKEQAARISGVRLPPGASNPTETKVNNLMAGIMASKAVSRLLPKSFTSGGGALVVNSAAADLARQVTSGSVLEGRASAVRKLLAEPEILAKMLVDMQGPEGGIVSRSVLEAYRAAALANFIQDDGSISFEAMIENDRNNLRADEIETALNFFEGGTP